MDLKALCAWRKPGLPKQLIKIMKLTIIFMLPVCLAASANGFGQTISLSETNANLSTVFQKIEKQSGYTFFYKVELLQNAKPVDISVKNVPLEQVLQLLFKDQPLAYNIVAKNIVVKEKTATTPIIEKMQLPPPPITVKGRVVNENGEGVIATVLVKGTNNGVTTNADGTFELKNVDENATLVISGVNIENAVEVKVNGKTDMGSIATVTKVATGETIIVSGGYYTVEDKKRTGSIIKISAKDIEKQPVTSLLMALQGRVPGLEISPNNGTPGTAPKIRIRGENSLRRGVIDDNGNYPLYIIDGLPVNATPLFSGATDGGTFTQSGPYTTGGFDPLSTINPANIESIEILKDADATAIYGSRGANGVILITTKKGSKGGKTEVDVSVYIGVGHVSNKLELLDTKQYVEMRREAFSKDNVTPVSSAGDDIVFWDVNRSTDWQEVLLGGSANITNVQAGVTGGNKNTSFRLGGGLHKETLVFPGDFGYRRITGSLSVNHESDNRKFKAGLSVNYGSDKNELLNDGGYLVFSALTLPPNAPSLYNAQGELNWEINTLPGTPPFRYNSFTNPLSYTKRTHENKISNLSTNGILSYQIIPSLIAKLNLGYNDLSSDEFYTIPISAIAPTSINANSRGQSNFGTNKRKSWIIEPQLFFTKNKNHHTFNIILGSTLQNSTDQSRVIRGSEYTSDASLKNLLAAPVITLQRDFNTDYKYNSIFARVGYDYKDKYLINLTGRRDGSSRFGPGKQFGNFGAIGLAWIFTEEKLFENNFKLLSFGKIRGSYGVTGNDQIGDYKYLNSYSIGPIYSSTPTISPSSLFNPDFAWEETKKLEAAIQLGFLNDKISIELSWYRNRSSNQLNDFVLPFTTGFPAVFTNFPAIIENSGWEFSLRTLNISTGNFKWTSSFNISDNNNKLISFPGLETSSYASTYKLGQPLSIQRLYTYIGVNPLTGLYEFEDINRDGLINNSDKQFMNPLDKAFYGGLNNTFSYKNLELSFLFQFSKQNAPRYLPATPGRYGNQPVGVLDRWQQPGDVTNVQRFGQSTVALTPFTRLQQSNYNFDDASFIRLKTLSLSYRAPKKMLDKLKIKDVSIFIQGQNLFTVTKYINLDPETGSALPPLRMINIGIQTKL